MCIYMQTTCHSWLIIVGGEGCLSYTLIHNLVLDNCSKQYISWDVNPFQGKIRVSDISLQNNV